jgi:hypothetical protein
MSTGRNSPRSIEAAPATAGAAVGNGAGIAANPILCEFCMTVQGKRGIKLGFGVNEADQARASIN